jgi:hypothetical protein
VEIAQKYADNLKEWRDKFPAPPVQSNSAIGENQGEDADKTKGDDDKTTATGDDKAKDDDNNDKKMTVGTTLSPEELDSYGEKIVKEGMFPDGTPNSLQSLRLVLATAKNGKSRVRLHNVGKKDVTVPTNTFVGKGGPGVFVWLGSQTLPDSEKKYAWKYVRITSHTRDVVARANA